MKKQSGTTIPRFLLIPLILVLASTTAFTALPVTSPAPQTETSEVIVEGIAYLSTQINEDGGFPWFDETSSVAATIKVVQALTAAGHFQAYLSSAVGVHPIDYLAANGADWVNQTETDTPAFSVARAGQLLTAIAAANENPQNFGAENADLIYAVKASYDPNTGAYGSAAPENVIDQVWAMLGLSANAFNVPAEAAIWLVNAQLDDGSWDDGYGSYLDTTPLAVMALIASGHVSLEDASLTAAIDFMMNTQQAEGGWQSEWDTTTNANTTAVMLQAISSLDQLPTNDTWLKASGNPQEALLTLQQESGVIGGDFANVYSTADAIIGLSGQTVYDLGYLYKADLSFDYLLAQQADNGGWGSVGQTLDVILALEAAGWDPNTITQSEQSPLDYVAENLAGYIESGPDAIGKAILGLTAAGADPTTFADVDLVAALNATYDETAGAFGAADNTWHQALAILGLDAAQAEIPEAAIETLLGLQQDDGGWEYTPGFGAWPDNTALALQALVATGMTKSDSAILDALDYIESQQISSGDWGDSSTTSNVILALNALEIELEYWNIMGASPLSTLFTYQKSNGAFVYNWEYPDDSLMSTASALLALFGGDYMVTADPTSAAYAGLVIDPGEGEATTVCVPLEGETTLSGLDLLAASGLLYNAPEGFVDSIMEIANTEGETNYWSYWAWNGSEWVFSNMGAGESEVLPGSIEAWHFTSWEIFPSLPPDVVPNLQVICEAPVLKNYAVQPSLGYSDLYPVELAQPEEAEPEEVAEPVEATEEPVENTPPTESATISTAATPTAEPEEASRSQTPIYIIVGLAVLALIVIVLLLKRK